MTATATATAAPFPAADELPDLGPGPWHTPDKCSKVRRVLSLVGDKWSVLVITMLGRDPMRFSELRRAIPAISQRMLTLTLRGLERDGLVKRTVTASLPPRVDYELTALGRSLAEPVGALNRWAVEHTDVIDEARESFDRLHPGA